MVYHECSDPEHTGSRMVPYSHIKGKLNTLLCPPGDSKAESLLQCNLCRRRRDANREAHVPQRATRNTTAIEALGRNLLEAQARQYTASDELSRLGPVEIVPDRRPRRASHVFFCYGDVDSAKHTHLEAREVDEIGPTISTVRVLPVEQHFLFNFASHIFIS